MKQRANEPRIEYLIRVLEEFMSTTSAGEQTIKYDEAVCDGLCLATDIALELGITVDV